MSIHMHSIWVEKPLTPVLCTAFCCPYHRNNMHAHSMVPKRNSVPHASSLPPKPQTELFPESGLPACEDQRAIGGNRVAEIAEEWWREVTLQASRRKAHDHPAPLISFNGTFPSYCDPVGKYKLLRGSHREPCLSEPAHDI